MSSETSKSSSTASTPRCKVTCSVRRSFARVRTTRDNITHPSSTDTIQDVQHTAQQAQLEVSTQIPASSIYLLLAQANPTERAHIVLSHIEASPQGRLHLPVMNGKAATLAGIDLSIKTLSVRLQPGIDLAWWNAKRNRITLRGANLRGADLRDSNLEGVDLADANLTGANLTGANLTGANLTGANLTHAVLTKAQLENARLSHTHMIQVDLSGATLQHAVLAYANLQDAVLVEADLTGANLQHANLIEVDFEGTILTRAKLGSATLPRADLTKAVIKHVAVSGAHLEGVHLTVEQLDGAIGEELEKDYTGARFGYLALRNNFRELGDYTAASWAYQRERQMSMKEAFALAASAMEKWQLRKAGPAFVRGMAELGADLLCGYGESLSKIILWMFAFLLVIGPIAIHIAGGLNWAEAKIATENYFNITSPLLRWLYTYLQVVLYMFDTFTTANFSELKPASDVVRLVSGALAMTGIFLTGLLAFVASNRIRQ